MNESNNQGLAAAVAQPNEGTTVHETLVLILRALRAQGCHRQATDTAAVSMQRETVNKRPTRAEVNARLRAALSVKR